MGRTVAFAGCCAWLFLGAQARAAELLAFGEFLRTDPFGEAVAADAPSGAEEVRRHAAGSPVVLEAARGSYVSFHLVVKIPGGGAYRLGLDAGSAKLQAELFREWYHLGSSDGRYYPDALIPVKIPYSSRLPDPENRIERQEAQAFWVDIWIPSDAAPGIYQGRASLHSGRESHLLPFRLKVHGPTVPDEDAVVVDHNSYGSSWLADQYPGVRVPGEESFRLTHLYHRIFYEHRGVFHQLGYGHGGRVNPEFAPALTGSGSTKSILNWDLYDRHYGPLLDGSAFAGSRRGARPIPYVYLPINPEWPASFLWWGEPGYEAEFVRVVSQMERHFREMDWTRTKFEMFFNHKKRYKAFPWDGDEVRFPEDDRYFLEFGRLLRKAVPLDSPVRFVFRNDTSWSMERQFRSLAGIVNFWVCGGIIFSWLPDAPALLKQRGDIVWIYGEAPGAGAVSSAITLHPLRAWLYGIDGYVHWLAVSPGSDPWFHFEGGTTALVYSGDRFGIRGPIPSIRLKIQRNCIQDLSLLDSFRSKHPIDVLRNEAALRFNGIGLADWWTRRPPMADLPPQEWTNSGIDEAAASSPILSRRVDSGAWLNVRRWIMKLASEAR